MTLDEQVVGSGQYGDADGRSGIQPLASGCTYIDVPQTYYTTLGFVAYNFWLRKSWCYGSTVTNVQATVYLSQVDPVYYYRGISNMWDQYSNYNRAHDSMRQGHFETCVLKYGCIGSTYPAVQIIAYSAGTYSAYKWF